MEYYEAVKSKETSILVVDVGGCLCEVVEIDGALLLYVDGHFEGELWEDENAEDYISQIEDILE
jgi:hypothetical protein